MTYYSIDDAHGTELTTGLQEHEVRAAAQRLANARGETVYVYDSDGSEYEHVDPDNGVTDEQIEALRDEAGANGDEEMHAIAVRALDGDDEARAECVRVIRDVQSRDPGRYED